MVANDDNKSKDKAKGADDVDREPVVDFNALPPEAIQSYISFYDLAQAYPPQDSSQQGNGSTSNGRKRKGRAASPTLASSGRKRNADAAGIDTVNANEKSSNKATDDEPPCPPHFFDADAATNYLGQVASRHFNSQPAPKEGEVVVGFLYKCRAKGELNRPLAHYRLRDPSNLKSQRQEAASNRSR